MKLIPKRPFPAPIPGTVIWHIPTAQPVLILDFRKELPEGFQGTRIPAVGLGNECIKPSRENWRLTEPNNYDFRDFSDILTKAQAKERDYWHHEKWKKPMITITSEYLAAIIDNPPTYGPFFGISEATYRLWSSKPMAMFTPSTVQYLVLTMYGTPTRTQPFPTEEAARAECGVGQYIAEVRVVSQASKTFSAPKPAKPAKAAKGKK